MMEKQEFKEARVVCLNHGLITDNFVLFYAINMDECEVIVFDLKEQPSEECHIYHS